MNDLRKKIFTTLFLVLSLLISCAFILVGVLEYSRTATQVQSDLAEAASRMEDLYRIFQRSRGSEDPSGSDWEEFTRNYGEEYYLLGQEPTYSILLTPTGSMWQPFIRGATQEEYYDEVEPLAYRIYATAAPGRMNVGNLFSSDYAWYYANDRNITIVDIRGVRTMLLRDFAWAGVLYALTLAVVYLLSRILTKWMLDPVEKTFEKQKQFVADASHELKTPLAVIMASAEAMEKDMNPHWLVNIQSETGRMTKLITALLDLTKTDEMELNRQVTDVSFLIEKELLIHEAIIFEKGLTLEDDIDPDLYASVQPDLIVQLFTILLDNAIHHSAGRLIVSLQKQNQDLVLRVSNNGKPIPEEEQEKIFERFYRSDASRNRSDNRYGLGLAIARNIALRHKGTLSVTSNAHLTTFTFAMKDAPAPETGRGHKALPGV